MTARDSFVRFKIYLLNANMNRDPILLLDASSLDDKLLDAISYHNMFTQGRAGLFCISLKWQASNHTTFISWISLESNMQVLYM